MEKIYRFIDIIEKEDFFIGKEIEIVSLSGEDDVYFNENMRCRITGFVKHEWESEMDSHLEILLDFKPFEDFNVLRMESNFYDANGNPKLKWIETPLYKNGQDSFYIMVHPSHFNERDDKNTFKLISENTIKLMDAFEKSGETNYMEFVEKLAIKSL